MLSYDFGVDENPFGHYINLEGRVKELADRLHAWYLSGDQLPEIFAEAQRKMADRLNQFDDPMDAPKEVLLEAFEEALAHFDNILMTFPQGIDDWCENDDE